MKTNKQTQYVFMDETSRYPRIRILFLKIAKEFLPPSQFPSYFFSKLTPKNHCTPKKTSKQKVMTFVCQYNYRIISVWKLWSAQVRGSSPHIPLILNDKPHLCPTDLGFSAHSLSACSKNKRQEHSRAYLASTRICSQQVWCCCMPSSPAAKSCEACPWTILLSGEIRLWCSTFWYKACVLEDFLLRFSKDSPPPPKT